MCQNPTSLFAQSVQSSGNQIANDNGLINGQVIDSQSGVAIAGATVSLHKGQTEKKTLSDTKGNFTFMNLPDGLYHITVTFLPGYLILS